MFYEDQIQMYESLRRALDSQEGCRMKGDFTVNEVPGIFRFSV